MENVLCLYYDIIVIGKNNGDHPENEEAIYIRLNEVNLNVYLDKTHFRKA